MTALSEACADIRDWQRARVARDRLLFGLSAIAIGLDRIEHGQPDEGMQLARHGLNFCTKQLDGHDD